MVKLLDDLSYPAPIDHIGWRLWRLAWAWKARFEAEMVGLGHTWFGEARSAVLAHLGPKGTPQSSLPGRMGLTKQAVQQLVDGLVEDGIVERRPDSDDRRGRIIALTPAGLSVMADAETVKRRIEADYRDLLGAGRFDALSRALDELHEKSAARTRG
jgi:DNA-binding MarR family transcriptional regulator